MLTLAHIRQTFAPGTPDEHTALKDINLNIHAGDFITVVGSNGAGKSTLYNVIAGTLRATAGRVLLDTEHGTQDITRTPEYKRARYIGRIFQNPLLGTAGKMTIEDNMMICSYKGYKKLRINLNKQKREQFRALLSDLGMGLEQRLRDNVELLSGGQRQALTLLMATMSKPAILLLDEHTAALDPTNASLVLDLTKRIASANALTVMMITHNMNYALDYGNRLLMMDEGEIVFDISKEEKAKLTLDDLVKRFKRLKKGGLTSDELLLTSC
ncbi:ABC transporter ATP-binding protein [Breznakiellaceae bacterium SP9]